MAAVEHAAVAFARGPIVRGRRRRSGDLYCTAKDVIRKAQKFREVRSEGNDFPQTAQNYLREELSAV